jgi:signal transduction histidine kinase
LEELREKVAGLMRQQRVTLSTVSEPLQVSLNRTHLRQLIEILVRHAVRHTVSESEIRISCGAHDRRVRLLLATPRPLPFQHELEALYEEFCAGRNRRLTLYGGAGVHLAIAGMLARWNGVEITGLSPSIGAGGFLLRMPGTVDSRQL